MEIELEQGRDKATISQLLTIREQIQNLKGDLVKTANTVFPAIDVIDEGEHFMIIADLPGVLAESLEITAQDRSIQLSGRRASQGAKQMLIQERQQGLFEKVISLPQEIHFQASKAELKQGVLTLILPKSS
jgi:HSP20 family protein